ncbi:MAG: DUF6036 family nucleotidyltransferase [Acidobacteriota bacterium]
MPQRYLIGIPPVRIDILMSVSGLNFDEAWANRIAIDFDGVSVNLISKKDLIITKLATGRPQDLIEAQLLSTTLKDDSREN